MSLTQEQLDAMYPSMKPEQQQPDAQPIVTDHDRAAVLFGETAYADATLHDVNTANLTNPGELEALKEQNEQWRDGLWAMELSGNEAVELTALVKQHAANPVSAEQQAQWLREVNERIVMQHGEEGARERLALAQKLAQRDPALVQRLAAAGLLNHPRIAEVAIARAWSSRAEGRLR